MWQSWSVARTVERIRQRKLQSRRRFRPAIAALEGRDLPATYFTVTGYPSPVPAGVAATVTVTARNADGSTDTSYWNMFRFSSSDPWAALPETNFLTNGTGTFTVKLCTAGTQSITVRDGANTAITGSQTGITVNPAATSRLEFNGWSSPATAGVSHAFTVTATDAYGNLTPSYAGTVHFTSSDPIAALPADAALTAGTRNFTATLNTAGTQTITAADTVNGTLTGVLAALPQTVPVYDQPPAASGYDKSAWYPPDGLDGDQYVWDSFVLTANQSVNQLRWRGCYTNYLSGAGQSPVFAFDVYVYGSIANGLQPDVTGSPLAHYAVTGNAGETPLGPVNGVQTYGYSYTLPTAFRAAAGTKYWVEIVASQGLTPFYYWPPDWSLAFGTGGNGSHFKEIIGGTGGGGNLYASVGGDIAYTLLTNANAPGIVVNPGTAPPRVSSVQVNDGSAQRSRVTGLTVGFNRVVSLPADPAAAFQLVRQGDGAVVNLAGTVTNATTTSLTLNFTGGAVDSGSLADGRYTLTVLASQVAGGTLDGIGGDNYALAGSPANKLFRLFGDADGNGAVDVLDFGAFLQAFGTADATFDFDASGGVDVLDFGAFRQRFGTNV